MTRRQNSLFFFLPIAAFLLIIFVFFKDSKGSEEEYYKETPIFASELILSAEEANWLSQHPKIRIAGPKAFPPFYFHDENGIEKGIAVDYIKLLLSQLGVEVDVHRDLPWPEVLGKADSKEIDLIALAAKSEEREKYLIFSDAYLSFPMVIITRTDAPFIGGLNDLYDKRIPCIKKVTTCEWLSNDLTSFQRVEVDTPLEGLEAVAFDKADAHLENLASASYQINTRGLQNLKIAAPTPYGNYNLHFAVRNDWPILASILNKTLSKISPQQHSKIRNRWLSIRYEHGIQLNDVFKWLGYTVAALLLPVIIILVWNRRLKQEIYKSEQMRLALVDSEKKFSAIFQHSPVPISISSIETGRYLDINQSVIDFTGYSRDEIIGKKAHELDIWITPEKREQFINKIAEEGSSHAMEFSLKDKADNIKHGLISGVKIMLENQPCILLATMDITELKRAEVKLKESQERYSALFERSLDPIFVYDMNGQLLDANPSALDILETNRSEITNLNFSDILDVKQFEEMMEQVGEIVKTGSQKELSEYRLKQKDGTSVCLETTGSLIFESGAPLAILGLGRDVSERKKAEHEQKRLISQLLEALDNIKTLKGMLPICANCKKIRDDSGYWNQIESYIEKHSDALFSHGICPDCANDLYGKMYK